MIIPASQDYTFVASFGQSRIGDVVSYQILDTNANVLCPADGTSWITTTIDGDANTYVETGKVQELGNGQYGISIKFRNVPFSGFIRYNNENDGLIISDPIIVSRDWLSELQRILGLSHENFKISGTTYDEYNNLETATLELFGEDATLTESPIASYTITSVGTAANKFSSLNQKKD